MFLSYAGYLACSMIALSAALTAFNWYYVPLIMGCEFALYLGVNASRGQLINPLEAPRSKSLSSLLHFSFYLMMCICPWIQIRVDSGNLGGRWYSTMTIYRLLSSAVIVIYTTSQFASIGGAAGVAMMSAETVRKMFFIALGVNIVGVTLFLSFVTSSRRWTFYSSKWTGPDFFKWFFDAFHLVDDADMKDHQRTVCWLITHPSYLSQEEVKEWLLGLKSDGDILGGGDKKIPKGCSDFSGHSLDSFLTKSLQRYAYYNDTEGFPLVKAHLEKLKQEVASRPLIDTIKLAVSRRSFKASDKEEEGNGMKAADEGEILRLKAALKEKEAELEEKEEVKELDNGIKAAEEILRLEASVAAKDALLIARDETIAQRDREIEELKAKKE